MRVNKWIEVWIFFENKSKQLIEKKILGKYNNFFSINNHHALQFKNPFENCECAQYFHL